MEHVAEIFSKKLPQNLFKTCLDNLLTNLGVFAILKNFKKHFEDSTLLGTLGKKNFQEKYPKTCSKHFWTIWERFWAFLEFWNFFDFLKAFRRLHPPWNTGQKEISEESTPKHVQNTFGQIGKVFGRFWSFETFFTSFRNNSKSRPSMEHWAKKFFGKITPKHVQNTFGHFWERFCAFLEIWKFLDFLKTFRRLDPPWNTGQKIFPKKVP